MSCMAHHGTPSWVPSPTMGTIPGCFRLARARISLRMLESCPASMILTDLSATRCDVSG